MKLPNADRALVELSKVTDYLLNSRHPDNGGKAQFFEALGFALSDSAQLAAVLGGLAVTGDVAHHVESAHGAKFVVDGWIDSPVGKRRAVRTVWIVDKGQDVPRLVTAYPHEG